MLFMETKKSTTIRAWVIKGLGEECRMSWTNMENKMDVKLLQGVHRALFGLLLGPKPGIYSGSRIPCRVPGAV